MKQHVAYVEIPTTEFARANRLLAIDSLSDLSDDDLLRLGANTHVCEGIFSARFDDGSVMNFDLCSGSENYFDDIVWTNKDGSRDIVLECEYVLDDIEVEIDGEEYVVRIIQV